MTSLTDFNGSAPLFPLPNAALFPHVVQPFHMFEPRYREMTADALAGDRYLALGVLKPGYEDKYNRKNAPIYDTVCLGRISDGERLPDGRYNVNVQGLVRARVIDEVDGPELYRVASLEIVEDVETGSDAEIRSAADNIVNAFGQLYPQLAEHPAVRKMLKSELPFSVLCDFIAHAIEIDCETAARVLCETDLLARGRVLSTWMNAKLSSETAKRPFPPAFSVN